MTASFICVGILVACGVLTMINGLPERVQLCATCLRACSGPYCSRACRRADEACMRERGAA